MMTQLPDWLTLWKELSRIQTRAFERERSGGAEDFWQAKAREFDKMAKKRWTTPDSSRKFLVNLLKTHPGSTLLDIGAGTGNWSLLSAPHAAAVTALDPSAAMQEILREKIRAADIGNITVRMGTWPESASETEPHDYVLASHSMYGVEDFKDFAGQMSRTAKKACIMVLRAPFARAPMGRICRRVMGHPYDSPNFQVAYNALLAMDIYPDVIMESQASWHVWTHDTLEQAIEEVKTRLNIWDDASHDAFIRDCLEAHLKQNKGKWVWPPGNRSALVYWEVD